MYYQIEAENMDHLKVIVGSLMALGYKFISCDAEYDVEEYCNNNNMRWPIITIYPKHKSFNGYKFKQEDSNNISLAEFHTILVKKEIDYKYSEYIDAMKKLISAYALGTHVRDVDSCPLCAITGITKGADIHIENCHTCPWVQITNNTCWNIHTEPLIRIKELADWIAIYEEKLASK